MKTYLITFTRAIFLTITSNAYWVPFTRRSENVYIFVMFIHNIVMFCKLINKK